MPSELLLHEPVVPEIPDVIAEQFRHHLRRPGTLNLHWRDVRFADLHVEPGVDRDPLSPEKYIAVGQREPEVVLAEAKQHRVVDDASIFGRDDHVLALPYGALRQISRGEHVGERKGVRTADLDLALDADVPDRDAVQQLPILGLKVVVARRQEHVIVHRIALRSVLQSRLEEGRSAQAGAALDELHVERGGHL